MCPLNQGLRNWSLWDCALFLVQKSGDVTLDLPGITNYLYENEFDCALLMVFTGSKQYLESTSAFPNRVSFTYKYPICIWEVWQDRYFPPLWAKRYVACLFVVQHQVGEGRISSFTSTALFWRRVIGEIPWSHTHCSASSTSTNRRRLLSNAVWWGGRCRCNNLSRSVLKELWMNQSR
jgi:hypothetical protein